MVGDFGVAIESDALGAAAHLLATGTPPFDGKSPQELWHVHVHTQYTPPAARPPREAYFFAVLQRALEKNADARFETAEAMAAALDTIAERPPAFAAALEDQATLGSLYVTLVKEDLAAYEADVLVNAANVELTM